MMDEAAREARELVEAMSAVLDRCVWSRTMTHESLLTYLVEESYELVDAVETGDADAMLEELGDVLLQIVFHAEIAARTAGEDFDFSDVARVAREKMVRRHPHVFAGVEAPTVEDVLRVWSAAKAAEKEKSTRTSALDGIPPQLPALVLADKMIGRAARAGVLPPDEAGAAPVEETLDEKALGEQLLAIVRSARSAGLDAERALRGAVRALQEEVRAEEARRDA